MLCGLIIIRYVYRRKLNFMKIHPIITNDIYKSNINDNKFMPTMSFVKESVSSDSFIVSKQKIANSLSFGASPVKLDLGKYANKAVLTGKEAIEIFEKFKSGNYLDLNGSARLKTDSRIRVENLSFMDKVVGLEDKKEFVEYYKKLTGFPDLWTVAYRLKEQFTKAVNVSESILKENANYSEKDYYNVLGFGYDGASSVARNKALPGSDLDKAYVIIKGHPKDDDLNKKIVNQYKSQLWQNTDQRVLSYNHDADSFPKIYTDKQVTDLVISMQMKDYRSLAEKFMPPTIYTSLGRLLIKPKESSFDFNPDFVSANAHFIKLCKRFPIAGSWELNTANPSRENIYSFGYILEALKRGEAFKKYDNYWIDTKGVADYINASQIKALRTGVGNKEKYDQRDKLASDFEHWSVDKQFRFVKSLILAGCGEETEFPEYFASNTEDKFMRIMKAVGLC